MMKSLTALAFAAIVAVPQEAAAFSAARSDAQSRIIVRPTSPTSFGGITHIYNAKTSHNVGPLRLSAAEDEMDGTSDGDKKIEGRKKRVIMGYKAMMITYFSAGLLSTAKATMSAALVQTIVGYLLVPAGISYIMISAAKHDRLSSDTYKRLNLALLQYGLIGLSIVSMGGKNSMLKLSFVLTIINTIKGYTYGAIGWDKQNTETTLLKDLVRVTQDTTKGFVSLPKNIKAFVYQIATINVASLKFIKLYEIVKFVQANSVTTGILPLLARFNRLSLLALMLYILRDAADRDRLGGTTFIQMNYLCALAMGVNYFHHSAGLVTPVGALSAAFALFFSFNGITSYMKNQYA